MSRPTAEDDADDRDCSRTFDLSRIADAAERIADHLETAGSPQLPMKPWVRKRLEEILGYTAPEALAMKIQQLLDETVEDDDKDDE